MEGSVNKQLKRHSTWFREVSTLITANILMSFTTMRIASLRLNSEDVVLALMTFVKRMPKTVTGCLSVGPRMKYYLKYRCPKPGCAVGVIDFPDKAGTLIRTTT